MFINHAMHIVGKQFVPDGKGLSSAHESRWIWTSGVHVAANQV
jgi:hypothetical protein